MTSMSAVHEARVAWRTPGVQAFLMAALVTVLAIGSGLVLREAVEHRTTTATLGGASSQVPGGWTTESGGGELAFVAYDPGDTATRFSVWVLPGPAGDLESAAASFAEQTLDAREGAIITSQSATRLGDDEAYELAYAFIDPEPRPLLVQGVVWLIARGDGLLAVTVEAPEDRFVRHVNRFRGLAATVELSP